jgi:TPR repeat protein
MTLCVSGAIDIRGAMEHELLRSGLSHRPWEKRGRSVLAPTTLALIACLPLMAIAWVTVGAVRRAGPVVVPGTNEMASVTAKEKLANALRDNALGVAYANGNGVPRDDHAALDLFASACAGGWTEGCSNQGALLEQGRGVSVDIEAASRLYQRACQGGSAIGCSNLGALYLETAGDAADQAYVRQLFEWACQRGSVVGCENRAALERPGALKRHDRI